MKKYNLFFFKIFICIFPMHYPVNEKNINNTEEIKKYADTGYDCALNHYNYEKASECLHEVFKQNSIKI